MKFVSKFTYACVYMLAVLMHTCLCVYTGQNLDPPVTLLASVPFSCTRINQTHCFGPVSSPDSLCSIRVVTQSAAATASSPTLCIKAFDAGNNTWVLMYFILERHFSSVVSCGKTIWWLCTFKL